MIRCSRQLRCWVGIDTEIRPVEIIFSGNAHQREKRIPSRIGEAAPMRCAEDISAIRHTGHSRRDPFPGRMFSDLTSSARARVFLMPVESMLRERAYAA